MRVPKHVLIVALATFAMISSAPAQTTTVPPDAKVQDLLRLLADPQVRAWIETQSVKAADGTAPAPAAAEPAPEEAQSSVATWEQGTRSRIDAVVSAIPTIPQQLAAVAARVWQDTVRHGYASLTLLFVGFVIAGVACETLLRRFMAHRSGTRRHHHGAVLSRLLPVLVFSFVTLVVFFAVQWPPLMRVVLLTYLIAFVAFRILATAIDLAMPAGTPETVAVRPHRAKRFLGVALFGLASTSLGPPLGIDAAVVATVGYLFSLLLVGLAIVSVWHTGSASRLWRWLMTGAAIGLWALWCVGLHVLFWLGVYIIVLPGLLRAVGHAVETAVSSRPGVHPKATRTVLLARGARAVVVCLAAAWIAVVWHVNVASFGGGDPIVTALLYGILRSVAVLMVADLGWHLAKALIDRKLHDASHEPGLVAEEAARRSRLRTLLPIFHNAFTAAVIVMVCLVVLSEVGVEIGPLIAGAGIFGVALGFGSQTLVKDIISGIFYMLDDAFRVGEYIQSKSYKGTVESFSLRSVRLRHQRGPVFTVPFSELGAVENMSRDWVIDKFQISVAYDTDIEAARKLTKAIGARLLEDEEIGPMLIQTLKMKGVEQFGDYGIQLSFAMTTVPGQQTYIRRKAYMMIREAFRENGIEFATPSVQVGGDDRGATAAAASAVQRVQAAKIVDGEK